MSEVMEKEETQTTELVTLPSKESALAVYSTVCGLDPLIDQIRAKVLGTVYDIKTAKGRAECASDAFKVAKSKAAIEKLGKALSAEYKEIPKKIDAERRRAFEELEALQHQVRRPLTEWEEAEEARVARHRNHIQHIEDTGRDLESCDVIALRSRLGGLEGIVIDERCEEFAAEAATVLGKSITAVRTALAAREKYEAEQAELAKLRADAEARAKKDEQDRIAREAAEAATKAAEVKAQVERDAAAKAAADAKAAAERRELELKLQAEKAEREKVEAQQRAEQAERDAKARAEQAERDAQTRAEAAAAAERQRQADEAARIEAETKAREADRAHKAKINNAAVAALVAGGLTAEAAKLTVTLICKDKVPAIKINY